MLCYSVIRAKTNPSDGFRKALEGLETKQGFEALEGLETKQGFERPRKVSKRLTLVETLT